MRRAAIPMREAARRMVEMVRSRSCSRSCHHLIGFIARARSGNLVLTISNRTIPNVSNEFQHVYIGRPFGRDLYRRTSDHSHNLIWSELQLSLDPGGCAAVPVGWSVRIGKKCCQVFTLHFILAPRSYLTTLLNVLEDHPCYINRASRLHRKGPLHNGQRGSVVPTPE